jgi:hypothetical protein
VKNYLVEFTDGTSKVLAADGCIADQGWMRFWKLSDAEDRALLPSVTVAFISATTTKLVTPEPDA